MSDLRLLRLRAELYTAAQILEGEDAREFWGLLDEIQSIRLAANPAAPGPGVAETEELARRAKEAKA